MNPILWEPSPAQIEGTRLQAYRHWLQRNRGLTFADYTGLWTWSVTEREAFWTSIWDFCNVRSGARGDVACVARDRMPGARWFPDARLNFAENLLRRTDDAPALVSWGEHKNRRQMSFAELRAQVSRLAQALSAAGVVAGDRVAGYMPNIPETVVAMLAAASLGAIWSSCSPDFGVAGVLDRFGQIRPKVLFSTDGYYYGGKVFHAEDRLAEIVRQIPSVEKLVVIPYLADDHPAREIDHAVLFDAFVGPFQAGPIAFAQLPFDHPLYIMYSSGTTGAPKCIVHGAGGTLLQHLKEHQLHGDVRPLDRVFYFTTCGWMMWNWLVSALASEATVVLYDGSPFFPRPRILWDMAAQERITFFGTSAKYIDAARKTALEPKALNQLPDLRTISSTGSPLVAESFDWVYRAIKSDVSLCSVSGGTDIISCFVLGDPTAPVRRGEIQVRGLGMRVEVFDDAGRSLTNEKGELVCTAPFPSMPVGFWNDPDGRRYHAAYFERFPNVWCHGDWVEMTESGGFIIYGRSDAVLNPGGVRIGTAEIYRQVEQLDEIEESIAIGQDWDNDVRVVLFVRLRNGIILDKDLTERIKKRIRDNTTPRHVPAKIIQVADIPRTKSGKITELAVRDVVHGKPVKNAEALANPDALNLFRDLAELKT